jgi:hypothetical protein
MPITEKMGLYGSLHQLLGIYMIIYDSLMTEVQYIISEFGMPN